MAPLRSSFKAPDYWQRAKALALASSAQGVAICCKVGSSLHNLWAKAPVVGVEIYADSITESGVLPQI